jgi:glycosyltransferase involved in cell wall biosynthesis
MFARADAILCNAPHARQQLALALPHFAEKLHTIPNGYDPDLFRRPSCPAPSGLSGLRVRGSLRFVRMARCGFFMPDTVYAGRDPGLYSMPLRNFQERKYRHYGSSSLAVPKLREESTCMKKS